MNISFVAFLNKRGIARRRPIDLAMITKNNGHTWLDLKSWGIMWTLAEGMGNWENCF